jgi:hypothetical protein
MRRHSLLGIALVIFLIWLFLVVVSHILGWLFNLLWIVIVIALILWLFRVIFGRRRRQQW